MRTRKMQEGFTLVEIMIVVAIIALLAAIAIPNLLRARMTSNDALAKATLRAMSTAAESYGTANNGNFPANETALTGQRLRILTHLIAVVHQLQVITMIVPVCPPPVIRSQRHRCLSTAQEAQRNHHVRWCFSSVIIISNRSIRKLRPQDGLFF